MDDSLVYNLVGVMPDGEQWLRVGARMLAALLLGAILGVQREFRNKPAGVRTHALVSLASAIFVLVPMEIGMQIADLSRVIQGVATEVGTEMRISPSDLDTARPLPELGLDSVMTVAIRRRLE